MLYTVVPYEVIFPQKISSPIYKRRGNTIIEMRDNGFGAQNAVRLHTTDLNEYIKGTRFQSRAFYGTRIK